MTEAEYVAAKASFDEQHAAWQASCGAVLKSNASSDMSYHYAKTAYDKYVADKAAYDAASTAWRLGYGAYRQSLASWEAKKAAFDRYSAEYAVYKKALDKYNSDLRIWQPLRDAWVKEYNRQMAGPIAASKLRFAEAGIAYPDWYAGCVSKEVKAAAEIECRRTTVRGLGGFLGAWATGSIATLPPCLVANLPECPPIPKEPTKPMWPGVAPIPVPPVGAPPTWSGGSPPTAPKPVAAPPVPTKGACAPEPVAPSPPDAPTSTIDTLAPPSDASGGMTTGGILLLLALGGLGAGGAYWYFKGRKKAR
jgi:hypothetical protein